VFVSASFIWLFSNPQTATPRRSFPEVSKFDARRRENLKSHKIENINLTQSKPHVESIPMACFL
jgi:hypothetical protein